MYSTLYGSAGILGYTQCPSALFHTHDEQRPCTAGNFLDTIGSILLSSIFDDRSNSTLSNTLDMPTTFVGGLAGPKPSALMWGTLTSG